MWSLTLQFDHIALDILGNVFCFARLRGCGVELTRGNISPPFVLAVVWSLHSACFEEHTSDPCLSHRARANLWPEVKVDHILAGASWSALFLPLGGWTWDLDCICPSSKFCLYFFLVPVMPLATHHYMNQWILCVRNVRLLLSLFPRPPLPMARDWPCLRLTRDCKYHIFLSWDCLTHCPLGSPVNAAHIPGIPLLGSSAWRSWFLSHIRRFTHIFSMRTV